MIRTLAVAVALAWPVMGAEEAERERLGPPAPQRVMRVAAEAPGQAVAEAAGAVATGAIEADVPELTLLDCIEAALLNNPDIGAAGEAIRKARGERTAALGQLYPNAKFSYSEVWQQQTKVAFAPGMPAATIVPGSTRTFGLGTTWVIWAGGALQANAQIARLAVEAAGQQHRAVVNAVVGQTVQAYLGLLKARELKQVADQAVEQAQAQVQVATDSFTAGAVPKVDVLRAEAALQGTLQRQLQADNGIALAGAQLNRLMGRGQLQPLRIAPLPRQLAETPELLPSLELAVAQRPELRAHQHAVEINRNAVRAARSGYLPTVALNGTMDTTSGAGQFRSEENFQVVFSVNWTLWDWFITAGKVRAADAELRAERHRFERTLLDIELQVRQAVLNLEEARRRVAAAEAEVAAARQAYEIKQLSYQAGEAILLEVLDARTAATQAEANLVNAYYDNALAEAQWLQAVGGYVADPETIRLPQNQSVAAPTGFRGRGIESGDLAHRYEVTPPAAEPK